MFLCAVARPQAGWNGLIGIWPVAEDYVTQRPSVYREAGDPCDQREVAAAPEEHQILIQQDHVPPHVLVNDAEVLHAANSDGWKTLIACQPACAEPGSKYLRSRVL